MAQRNPKFAKNLTPTAHTGLRKLDGAERRKIVLMRRALTKSEMRHTISGQDRKDQRTPSMPKMPWDA